MKGLCIVFIERLNELLKRKGVSAHKMSLELGLSKSVYTAWKERGNIPTGDVLDKIADYFNVSTDYLLGRTEDPRRLEDIPVALSAPKGYDALTPEGKKQIDELIKMLPKEPKL